MKDRELEKVLRNPIRCVCPLVPDPRQDGRVRQSTPSGSHCLWCGLQLPKVGA